MKKKFLLIVLLYNCCMYASYRESDAQEDQRRMHYNQEISRMGTLLVDLHRMNITPATITPALLVAKEANCTDTLVYKVTIADYNNYKHIDKNYENNPSVCSILNQSGECFARIIVYKRFNNNIEYLYSFSCLSNYKGNEEYNSNILCSQHLFQNKNGSYEGGW